MKISNLLRVSEILVGLSGKKRLFCKNVNYDPDVVMKNTCSETTDIALKKLS